MKTLEEIDKLLNKIRETGLEGADFVFSFPRETIQREYNGIGPEWAGEAAREKATKFLDLFQPAALIHDMRNHVGDATRRAFDFANLEFRENCLKLADLAYPWYSWRRYRARAVALLLFEFVQGAPGWIAWIEASSKNLNKESN